MRLGHEKQKPWGLQGQSYFPDMVEGKEANVKLLGTASRMKRLMDVIHA